MRVLFNVFSCLLTSSTMKNPFARSLFEMLAFVKSPSDMQGWNGPQCLTGLNHISTFWWRHFIFRHRPGHMKCFEHVANEREQFGTQMIVPLEPTAVLARIHTPQKEFLGLLRKGRWPLFQFKAHVHNSNSEHRITNCYTQTPSFMKVIAYLDRGVVP